jgi:hypothetical protein
MIPHNKNMRQLVWHLKHIDNAVEGSELYFYNTEGDRILIVSQTSCRMDVTRLEWHAYIKIASPPCDSSLRKDIVPHGFHKVTVVFSSISLSQYVYLLKAIY